MNETDLSKLPFNESIEIKLKEIEKRVIELENTVKMSDDYHNISAKSGWDWFRGTFFEFTNLYKCVKRLYEENQKLSQHMQEVLARFLGLSSNATWEEIQGRANDFGGFSETLINKAKEEKEAEKYT